MLLNNFRRVLVNTIAAGLTLRQTNGMSEEIRVTSGILYKPNRNVLGYPYIDGLNNDCSICTVSSAYDNTEVPATSISFTASQIVLGTGDTAPTIDDYKLSGDLIIGLTSQDRATSANNNSVTFSAIATNNTDNPVTVKEIGLAGLTLSQPCMILLTRDVLPTPVTLNTGDSKTFSITIDFRSLTNSLNNGN